MHRIVLAATLAATVLVAACGGASAPSPSPSDLPSSPVPTAPAPASPTPDPSDAPTPGPTDAPSDAPSEAPATPTAQEQHLLDGVLRGARDCQPVSEGLPEGAVAGIQCAADDPAVAQVGFYLFADEAAMLDVYFARMADEGIVIESGSCIDGEREGSYIPYEGISPDREGCFINDQGYANYRATRSGTNVYIGILGNSDDTAALSAFAWRGNQDTPGNPTLWGEPAD